MATILPSRKKSPGHSAQPLNGRMQAVWHKSAPRAVRQAFRSGDESKGWTAWTKHLRKRSRPLVLGKLLPGRNGPLTWGLPDGAEQRGYRAFLAQVDRLGSKPRPGGDSPEKAVLTWLAEAAGTDLDPGYALEALAWCHALPRLAEPLLPEVWWDLLDHLLAAADEADQIELDANPLAHQLLAGELALALSYQFPEIEPCRKLARRARRALSAGLVDLLDGGGIPQGRYLGLLRPLMACWTRCRALGNTLSKDCWSAAAEAQYEWLVRVALRLTRHDGTEALSDGAGGWCPELSEAALGLGGNEEDEAIAALLLPGRKKTRDARLGKLALPKASVHSEWACTSVLSPGWARSDPRLVAVYTDRSVRIELDCLRDVLWSGAWELEVCRDGEPAEPSSDWEEICWSSDEEGDYLELEITLGEGLRVQRQIFLARVDRFLFLADAVLGTRPARLEYRSRLPLAEGIAYQPARRTWEGVVVGRKPAAAVLPLALPEWRSDPRVDTLAATGGGLELCRSARGSALYCPLFFDLKPRRLTRPLTWRQLTVAQSLAIQPDDVAVGYRVQVGKQQWLIYRSLAPSANRTLLGHNLSNEMFIGRFERNGEIDPLVEIE